MTYTPTQNAPPVSLCMFQCYDMCGRACAVHSGVCMWVCVRTFVWVFANGYQFAFVWPLAVIGENEWVVPYISVCMCVNKCLSVT